jgi:hypothetical protein
MLKTMNTRFEKGDVLGGGLSIAIARLNEVHGRQSQIVVRGQEFKLVLQGFVADLVCKLRKLSCISILDLQRLGNDDFLIAWCGSAVPMSSAMHISVLRLAIVKLC